MPKAVIFDIGSVIVRLDPRQAFAPLASALKQAGTPSPEVRSGKDAWDLIRSDERWQDWQEGRISPDQWHQHVMRRLKLSLTFEEFRDAWNRVLDPDLILSETLFVRLADRCRLALLSNTDPIHAACLEERFTFGRHFPVRIYSCAVGACKPSAAIYHRALEGLGVRAGEALYVDDMKEFVRAAREIGLDAVQFRSPKRLQEDLARRHLP
jgi:putative hydrolase of the HAD superfamily